MSNQQTVMVTTPTFDTKPQCLFSASLYYILGVIEAFIAGTNLIRHDYMYLTIDLIAVIIFGILIYLTIKRTGYGKTETHVFPQTLPAEDKTSGQTIH